MITLVSQNNLAKFEHLNQMWWASVPSLVLWIGTCDCSKKEKLHCSALRNAKHQFVSQRHNLHWWELSLAQRSATHTHTAWVARRSQQIWEGTSEGTGYLPFLLGKWCSYPRETDWACERFLPRQWLSDACEGLTGTKHEICVTKAVRFHLYWKSTDSLLCVLPLASQPGKMLLKPV